METKKENTNDSGGLLNYRVFGIPLWVFLGGTVVLTLGLLIHKPLPAGADPSKLQISMPLNIISTLAVLIVFGHILGELGNRLPIWKDYFGGGALLAFVGTSFLVSQNVIPQSVVKTTHEIFDKYGALDFWVIIAITNSILSIDRKLLGKAVGGFIPMVIVGTIVAFGGAILGGFLVGIPFKEAVLNYALPIMGGGNGAGAVPMSQIWGSVTGGDPKSWYSAAISILTIANIIAVIVASILNGIGKKFPQYSGNGELLRGTSATAADEKKEAVKATMDDATAGLFIILSFYILANVIGDGLLPSIGGIKIHPYAYMVVLLVLANALNIFPERMKAGVKMINKFMLKSLFYVFLAGVGIAYTRFDALVDAASLPTLVICTFTVLGATIGCWFFARVVGFYEVESAIAGGLCHVNRGGTGDMEVLGAANRMNLMSYAQVATRLGGAMILVLASFLFGIWAK